MFDGPSNGPVHGFVVSFKAPLRGFRVYGLGGF